MNAKEWHPIADYEVEPSSLATLHEGKHGCEYSDFLKRNPCPGAADLQRDSSTPNSAWHSSLGFFRVHPRQRRPRHLAHAQVVQLARR